MQLEFHHGLLRSMVRYDLKFALRALIKRPGFAFVAIATLALGIGANTAIFSVVEAVLLRPLPYGSANRIVRVRGWVSRTSQPGNLSPMDFLDLRARTRRFERLAAYNNYADTTLTGAGDPERISGTRVTADFFSVLQVTPLAGRDFRREDVARGAAAAILAHGFWQRRFGGDRSVIGRVIQLNGVPTEVIGVLPAWFRHPFPDNARQPDVFVPFIVEENNRGGHYLQAIGLLRPDVPLSDGRADLETIAADLEREYPATNAGRSIILEPLRDSIVGAVRPALYVLFGTVAFVLLIACANLANLLLARSASRQKEIAVRQALGASRPRLVRQLLVENVVLSLAGGASGCVLAAAAVRLLVLIGADRIPRGDTITVDARVLLFALALSLATGIVFGIGPAWAATRREPQGALNEGGRSGDSASHGRVQRALIASETALALMLMVSAGLLVKSLWRLQNVDPGFEPQQVVTLRTSVPLARYPEGDEIPFYARLEDRLAPLPGIHRIGAINILPLSGNYSCDRFDIEGRSPAPPGQGPCAEARSVTPGYFAAMGVPLLRGRPFTRQDTEQSPPVTIISDNMARRFWAGGDPLGSRILYRDKPRVVIGIVAGVKHFGLDRAAPLEMYTPHAQQPSYHTMTLIIRTPADAVSLVPLIRRELSALDSAIPISDIRTMERVVADSTTEPRFRTLLVGGFAALAIILSVVGVAGVTAYAVSRRTREIGVRIALGATRGSVVVLMVSQGFTATAAGLAAGIAGALALTRLLSQFLFGVTATDPAAFAGATALVTVAALAATYVPARRAASIDPMLTLRAE